MRLTKTAGAAASLGLACAAAMHAIWTVTPWPRASYSDLARTVVGNTEEFPPPPLTGAVAVALGAAAYLVAAQARLAPSIAPPRLLRTGVWTVAGVLTARGIAGLISSGLTGPSTAYTRMDLALYSPLCLAIGALTTYVAVSTGRAPTVGSARPAHR
ncbi:DUF3995 domain-containing protein [Nonomuraea endophytica]|uniref:DUF3995 domain-containing protein n=1 Tax=Nonomuraea endophytica TaxID=714136 RepID=UPI0037C64189